MYFRLCEAIIFQVQSENVGKASQLIIQLNNCNELALRPAS